MTISINSTRLTPESPGPVIALPHGARESYLPDMTPGEAVALAAALVRAAWSADPGALQAAAGQEPPRHIGGSCPPWCCYGPHDPIDVHVSDGNAVDVADSGHACSRTREGGEQPCDDDVCAELFVTEGDRPGVQLHHGDDCLPAITLSGAEALGWKLLRLACTGRGPAPAA